MRHLGFAGVEAIRTNAQIVRSPTRFHFFIVCLLVTYLGNRSSPRRCLSPRIALTAYQFPAQLHNARATCPALFSCLPSLLEFRTTCGRAVLPAPCAVNWHFIAGPTAPCL